MQTPARDEDWFPPRLGGVAVGLAFAVLSWWSWGKWTDVQIDFGVELYIPWQITEGRALYQDMALRHGPLSPYVNALWFTLFGVSIQTLVWCNLAILAAIAGMTYRLFVIACGRFTATVCCLVLLSVFGFSQYVQIANYNYVTPYQHFQTHGLALSLGMILALWKGARPGRSTLVWNGVAGVCLGAVFLTKMELFVPAAVTAVAGLAVSLRVQTVSGARWGRSLVAMAAGALLPVLGFLAVLAASMPLDVALRGLCGNWAHLGGAGTSLLDDAFYRQGIGLDDVAGNLGDMLSSFGLVAMVAGVAVALDLWAGRLGKWGALAAALVVAVTLLVAPDLVRWPRLARALPVTSALAIVALTWRCRSARTDGEALLRRLPLVAFSVLSLSLLGKMFLRARFFHYGFVLAMPATLLLVSILLNGLPAWLAGRGRGVSFTRGIGLAVILAGTVFFLNWSRAAYSGKDLRVGTGADSILVDNPDKDPRGAMVAQAMESLERIVPADGSLLVLPEGAQLNYWLRRPSPSRYTLFLPTELAAFGSDTVLEDIRTHPPDVVVLMDRGFSEFGVGPFGVDPSNGKRIVKWIRAHYRLVDRFGAEPFTGRGFGISILGRAGS